MAGKHRIRLGKREIPLPASPLARLLIGGLFLLGGCFWFLPVLGLWMIPVGLVVLSIDFAFARRMRRRGEVWWGRHKEK